MSRRPPPPRSIVARITAILSTFHSGSGHSVTEIARLTGLPVSTTHRLATELAAWQVLQRSADGTYRVGPALHMLDGHGWSLPTLEERAPRLLTDLCDATRQRVRLGMLVDGRVGYVEKRVGPEPVTAFSRSTTLPAHATALGKALLAFAPHATVAVLAQRLTVFTSQTLDTPERLRRALRRIRLTKIAISCGELVEGDFAVAVPVFAPGGDVVAALEVAVVDPRTDFHVSRAALIVAAGALSRELAAAPDRSHLRVVPAPHDRGLPTELGTTRPAAGG